MEGLLVLKQVEAFIQHYHILHDISFEVPKGEVTVLLGRNGAGKTTTLRTIMGLNQVSKGTVSFKGEAIANRTTHQIANKGIGYVPEDQGIFNGLTVGENMRVAMKKEDEETMKRMEWVLELFPDLKKYWKKEGGQLSGGQKQMLAIARAYVNKNDLLLIDEPSKGLAPIIVDKVTESIQQMKEQTTIVLVEQNFMMASKIGNRFYIIDDGVTVHHGKMDELKEDKITMKKYLGIS
ncbi:ABC transporter ATP-binding protein [Oceanobacillus polygoni]|uniref:Branched-chain amino acid transport system ATP-binding protein n=1 Tax=Oceanobacillus polygoni TaxID=1235259 RepID=A0A9X0Z0K4_9BACI|nr:ABC transporter ATP-binding protein [Oceanobacillus polygoni]MBP2079745.1 branched-chain amino acid transport system ATP-binding protein [Oceanobacillus polygoni]